MEATSVEKRNSDGNGNRDVTAASQSQHGNSFATLSDEIWNMISSFAAPPDVYSLALSSVHFFHEVSDVVVVEEAASMEAAGAERNALLSDDKKVLATQLLRTSLLSSLEKVLEKSETRITLDALFKMGELPEGSALIAGSTMVAACLGKDWGPNTDVDVYCSAVAAPQVRSVRLAFCTQWMNLDNDFDSLVRCSNYLRFVKFLLFYHSGWWKRRIKCSSE